MAGGRAELVAAGTEFTIAYDPATGTELWRSKGTESNIIPSPVYGNGIDLRHVGISVKRVCWPLARLEAAGGTAEIVWTYARGTAYVTSPILVGESLYSRPTAAF